MTPVLPVAAERARRSGPGKDSQGAPGQGLGTGEGGGAASWYEVTTQRNPAEVRSPQPPARSFLRDSGAASAATGLAGERDEQDDGAGD